MANIVVKTIWQSKEINEAGDTPTGIESWAQGSKEQLGKPASVKVFPKKKKAVSFHGVEPHLTGESPNLNLKRSSACTNVSLLNLTDGEHEDSTIENESTDDGGLPGGAVGERQDSPIPIKPAWSEDEDDTSGQQQEVSSSGLLRAKDSITSLKERTPKVKCHVHSLQSECTMLCENLEQHRQMAEDLDDYCTQLKESCRKVTKSVEDAEIKTSLLKKNSVLLEEKLHDLQQKVEAEDLGRPELEEIRKSMLELAGWAQRDGLTQKEVLRLLAQLGVRLEGALPQWERTQEEQGRVLRMLREELDDVSATAKRTSVSLTQLCADLGGLWQVKPLLEDVSRHLATLRNTEVPNRPPPSCARCSSYSIVNAEMLRQMVEQAMAPVLEELKQRAPSAGMCPSCQHLQKKIMDLEQSALKAHAQTEALSSNVRLAQDEALRAKNYLERTRIAVEDKTHSLGYLQDKLSSLHSQLSPVSPEGAPQSPANAIAASVTLSKQSSCPAELNRHPQ
ncbi:testis-specific serine kinase substrate-like [Candoia aspera]|uniref:testis-specific serine kinase substrate-like n=1 Tax=Candoia aspera TaxID=51853 RepID=UPI002FD80F4F